MVLPAFHAPDWIFRALIVIGRIVFVVLMIVTWLYELTTQGLKREEEVARDRRLKPLFGRRQMNALLTVVLAVALGFSLYGNYRADRLGNVLGARPRRSKSTRPAIKRRGRAMRFGIVRDSTKIRAKTGISLHSLARPFPDAKRGLAGLPDPLSLRDDDHAGELAANHARYSCGYPSADARSQPMRLCIFYSREVSAEGGIEIGQRPIVRPSIKPVAKLSAPLHDCLAPFEVAQAKDTQGGRVIDARRRTPRKAVEKRDAAMAFPPHFPVRKDVQRSSTRPQDTCDLF
jgi:hypothetical protein